MVADTRTLLVEVRGYRTHLDKHFKQIKQELDQLQNRWRSLSPLYQGEAAEQFGANWSRTSERFNEYVSRLQQIIKILDDHIHTLEESDNKEDM